jgi:very-short-patch-repair endonuclease
MEILISCEVQICDCIVKATGNKCDKRASYQDKNGYRCGIHSNKETRTLLAKIPKIPQKKVGKYTLPIFLKKAKEIHGNNFDYSQITDKHINNGAHSLLLICCNICKYIWSQKLYSHITGKAGCPSCKGLAQWTLDRFLTRAILIHGEKYNYSQVTEKDINGKNSFVKLICNTCEYEWSVVIDSHINCKSGCPDCGNVAIWTLGRFLLKAEIIHGKIFDYSEITEEHINNSQSFLPITCTICKYRWSPSIRCHINSKRGCPSCSETVQWTLKKFLLIAPTIHLINRKYGCPNCKHKTERKLFDILKLQFNTIERQFKADWCKNKTYLPFDFVLKNEKIIIELDGRQHFTQISNWQSPKITQERDVYKMKCANENGYTVIRILQEDIFYDKYDWLSDLVFAIEKIKGENITQNIFICKNNEYNNFGTISDI